MINSDVVLATLPFGGTLWVHKILQNLLHLIDDDGHLAQANEAPSTTGTVCVGGVFRSVNMAICMCVCLRVRVCV